VNVRDMRMVQRGEDLGLAVQPREDFRTVRACFRLEAPCATSAGRLWSTRHGGATMALT
jgi:hypothetical protein